MLTVGANNVAGGEKRYDCHFELKEAAMCVWLKDDKPIFESSKYHIVNIEQSLTFCRLYVSSASEEMVLCYIFFNNTICDQYGTINLSKKGNYKIAIYVCTIRI